MKRNSIQNCNIIDISTVSDQRGKLSFTEKGVCPFEINRVYYMYDIPEDTHRGGHAHKNLHQIIIAIAGKFSVQLDDGTNKKVFTLSDPSIGLYVCPMIWRNLSMFTKGSVCLVLASDVYKEDDYIRDYDDFLMGKLNR